METNFIKRMVRLKARGVDEVHAATYLKSSEVEALEKILIDKGIFTLEEIDKYKDEAQEKYTQEIERLTPDKLSHD